MIRERLSKMRDWLEMPDPALAPRPRYCTYGGVNERGYITVATELYNPTSDINWKSNSSTCKEDRVMVITTVNNEYVYVQGREVLVERDGPNGDRLISDSVVLGHVDDLQGAPKDQPWQITPGLVVGQIKSLFVKQGEFTQTQLAAMEDIPPLHSRIHNRFDTTALLFKQMRLDQQRPSTVPEAEPVVEAASQASLSEEPKTEAEHSEPGTNTSFNFNRNSLLNRALRGSVQLAESVKSEIKNYYGDEINGQSHRLVSLAVGAVALMVLTRPRGRN